MTAVAGGDRTRTSTSASAGTSAVTSGPPSALAAFPVATGDPAALPPVAADATRVLLVRHGATAWNLEGRHQGVTDVPLNDEGRAQAAALGRLLGGVRIDAAYTSPLGRAADTAALVLAGRPVRAAALPALAELSYGERQGQRRADWIASEPAFVARWDAEPWTVTFPGGESLVDVHRRAAPVWDALVARHRGQTVLVSAHGHLNRVLLVHALGLPRAAFWTLPQPNAACVVVDAAPGSPGAASAVMLAG